MGEEGKPAADAEVETPAAPSAPPAPVEEAPTAPPAEEKGVDLPAPEEKRVDLPAPEEKQDDSKALAVVEKPLEPQKSSGGSIDRDIALARVETEKRTSLIKAWEDSEKSKAENKASKELSKIGSWENTKKATIEAMLKQNEEKLEKQKAEYAEKMKNKMAMIHKEAEEKKIIVEARKGEELLKAEELAAKYRATGKPPKKLLGCFGS